jgi:hypothetical protein
MTQVPPELSGKIARPDLLSLFSGRPIRAPREKAQPEISPTVPVYGGIVKTAVKVRSTPGATSGTRALEKAEKGQRQLLAHSFAKN